MVPSLFLIIFSFWCFFPKSLLLTFHSGVSLKSWPLVLLFLRPLTFFRLSFWLPFLLSFVLSELIPSCWVDSLPNYFPSWFFILGSPRYQPLVHELLVSKLSSSLIGMYLFSFLVFLGTPFYLSWSHPGFVARPKDPEPLAIPGYPSPVFTIGLPSDFLTLVGWAFFSSSLCFMNSKAYLFVGLGSSLYPLMELGLPYFFLYYGLKSFIFSWSSTLCAILGLGATWWLFQTSTHTQ